MYVIHICVVTYVADSGNTIIGSVLLTAAGTSEWPSQHYLGQTILILKQINLCISATCSTLVWFAHERGSLVTYHLSLAPETWIGLFQSQPHWLFQRDPSCGENLPEHHCRWVQCSLNVSRFPLLPSHVARDQNKRWPKDEKLLSWSWYLWLLLENRK